VLSFFILEENNFYSATIASAGQTAAQAPQSIHFSASILKMGAPSSMASTGHSGLQVPQAVHLFVILYAMGHILSLMSA